MMQLMERFAPNRLTYKVHLPGGQSRLREMILFVSAEAQSASRWGKTKLNKMLWRADFTAFSDRGVPVTGRPYQRLPNGPAPVEMAPLLADMLRADLIKVDRNTFTDIVAEERIIPLQKANTRWFSEDDLSYVRRAIDFYWEDTAGQASDDSHGLAWKSRQDGDPMPYESAYLSDRRLPLEYEQKFAAMGRERRWKSQ